MAGFDPERRVQAVIFDWAGTTVDYGSFAPVQAFMSVFQNQGITVSPETVRKPMGALKREHLRQICGMEQVDRQFQELWGRSANADDIAKLYAEFEPMLIQVLPQYSQPVPGAAQLMANLRERGIKIGSTTGYTDAMMAIVAREAGRYGYAPDVVVTPDRVAAGRPAPYMCYLNAIKLEVYPLDRMVKVGDTPNDILEGVNAGVWTVGVIQGGSELGLTAAEVAAEPPAELARRSQVIREHFRGLGAHYVMDQLGDLETVIADIDQKLRAGMSPAGGGRR